MKTDITLWLPGAISPYLASGHGQLSAMLKLLSRANKQIGMTSFEQALKSYFSGISGEIPRGALAALSHGLIEKNNKATWCLVSPATCILTHQTAMLSGPLQLEISTEEITALTRLLNQHLNTDQLHLTTIHSEWYCQVTKNLDVVMNDMLEALYKNMIHYLPSGPHQAYWQRLFTECQMLLQTCAANEKRMLLNLPLISCLWFSGLGPLPSHTKTDFELIYTNESLIKGLALCADCPVVSFDSMDMLPQCQKKKILIADFELYRQLKQQDEQAWLELLMHYEKHVFSPLIKALSTSQIATLTLNFNDGYLYRLTKGTLKYFWRKIRTLKHFA